MSLTATELPSPDQIAKLPADGGPDFNRLVFESSPYLRLHARNPVDWFAWNDAAFDKARKEDKPVLLSVGYSTCHWCHVMARESFADEQVAAFLNEHFVSIKVDREERPDIDEIYMTVTQALTGQGGWPMTVMMTPERKPFFAGTYFPKEDRAGRSGFLTILRELNRVWREKRDQITTTADRITNGIAGMSESTPGEAPDAAILSRAREILAATFDPAHAGFGTGNKFPMPQTLSFLLRQSQRDGNAETLAMAEHTLAEIRDGAVYDHLGHGIHRYSTDARWELPHFEKMLYDQALYVTALIDAWQVTSKQEYATTARDVLGYVLRTMTAPQGGFYSAEDAQSEGVEGKFYLWTPDQVSALLGKDDARLFNTAYQIVPEGNYRDEATRARTGDSIPRRSPASRNGSLARRFGLTPEQLDTRLAASRQKLFDAREKRVRPPLDDKVLTDWNGLMIAAMARAGRALDEPRFLKAAAKAADFILGDVRRDDGRLLKRWRAGSAGLDAHLEDYAFFVRGLIELHQATRDPQWLRHALTLNQVMIDDFADDENGGFFMTSDHGEKLIVRVKKLHGGAIPAGNEVAALNLLQLARLTGDTQLEDRYDQLVRSFAGEINRHPSALPALLQAIEFATGPSHEIVIAGKPGAEDSAAMLAALDHRFLPNSVILFRPDDGDSIPPICKLAPFTRDQRAIDDKATAYVCRNFACQQPTTEIERMLGNLK